MLSKIFGKSGNLDDLNQNLLTEYEAQSKELDQLRDQVATLQRENEEYLAELTQLREENIAFRNEQESLQAEKDALATEKLAWEKEPVAEGIETKGEGEPSAKPRARYAWEVQADKDLGFIQ